MRGKKKKRNQDIPVGTHNAEKAENLQPIEMFKVSYCAVDFQ